ncbi:MAG: tRNA pseudouridine(38-40) synthase TruA [Neisseria sp.]|nr:tRNA pseudouridine(38-40) synthase TruA [Neisseria sp.]
MARIALHIHYLGTAFHGWQKQAHDLNTIQAALENAVAQIAGHPVQLIAAGRTDRGVHALGQMAHFDTDTVRPNNAWVAGVNTFLPPEIAVIAAQTVAPDFHARFDACRRSYRYVLSNAAVRPSILRERVGWTFVPLDIPSMQQAAHHLLGEQDFSSFRSSDCQAKTPIKTLYTADIYSSNGLICFDFSASGFLHHMVRNMVGALLYVGQGKLNTTQFCEVIAAKNRLRAPPTFMADGLYLTRIDYPARCAIEQPPLPTWFWGKHDNFTASH